MGTLTVLQIQHLLVFLGYDTGGVKGILGPKTKAAAYDFQKEFGGLALAGYQRITPQIEAFMRSL